MAQQNARKMFVNLAVRDLKRSKEFFSALGFSYNPKFTDDKAACMVVSDEAVSYTHLTLPTIYSV